MVVRAVRPDLDLYAAAPRPDSITDDVCIHFDGGWVYFKPVYRPVSLHLDHLYYFVYTIRNLGCAGTPILARLWRRAHNVLRSGLLVLSQNVLAAEDLFRAQVRADHPGTNGCGDG